MERVHTKEMLPLLDNRYMRKLILALLISIPSLAIAQQSPLYSQYMLNDFVINPAIAGSKPFYPLRVNAREQWEGLGSLRHLHNH